MDGQRKKQKKTTITYSTLHTTHQEQSMSNDFNSIFPFFRNIILTYQVCACASAVEKFVCIHSTKFRVLHVDVRFKFHVHMRELLGRFFFVIVDVVGLGCVQCMRHAITLSICWSTFLFVKWHRGKPTLCHRLCSHKSYRIAVIRRKNAEKIFSERKWMWER